ncbi:hypothetical protein F4776DRAFT_663420 [Hypoxylon sp. NC0597]|nr:hypothetical protein F4776DRAFT_663420 [Hypoxylon sp. NC0597]
MGYQKMLLALFTLAAATQATASPVLFHGTSVVILPSETSSLNDNTLRATEFFSYMTETGYLNFGWWVPPSSIGNCSHCRPDSDSFHWIEFAQRKSCNEETGTCLYRAQHVPVREPDGELAPSWDKPLEYVVQPQASEKASGEEIALSYIDEDGVQFHGIGTRRKLNDEPRAAVECWKVLRTLKQTYERLDIDLRFEIGNPCVQDTNIDYDLVSEL